MSLYFFNIRNHELLLDTQGLEIADTTGVANAAIEAAREVMANLGHSFWNGNAWHMWVTNEDHVLVYSITVTGFDYRATNGTDLEG